MIYNVIINTGYAESSVVSSLIMNYEAEEGLSGVEIANRFAKFLKTFVHNVEPTSCCSKYFKMDLRFCGGCGSKLVAQEDIDIDADTLFRHIIDSTAECFDEEYDGLDYALNDEGWDVWGKLQSGPLIEISDFGALIDSERYSNHVNIYTSNITIDGRAYEKYD